MLLVALLLSTVVGTQGIRAHGGVVIDSGFTNYFEWLVSINPYPVTTGEATITLLVFDVTTYDPVNDLRATLHPTSPTGEQLSAGVNLTIDPAIYPGDYSANIPLDQAGEWQLQFVVEGGDKSFEITVPVKVVAAPVAQALGAEMTPDLVATATVFAQNVQLARQQNSPLPALVSPLVLNNPVESVVAMMNTLAAAHLFGIAWWLWGLVAIIPIFMGWLLLRSPKQTTIDETNDEIDSSDDDDQPPPDAALKESDV